MTSIDLGWGSQTPRGFLLYLGRVVRQWDVQEAMRHAGKVRRAGGIRHVALCAEGTDGFVAKLPILVDCARVYREIAGVEVSAFSLPGATALARPSDGVPIRLAIAAAAIYAWARILDAEEAYRGKAALLTRHRRRMIDDARESVSLGCTLYGSPTERADGIEGYPWQAIRGFGWLGWQCYEKAAKRELVRKILRVLRGPTWWGPDVVPHIATYQRKTAVPGELRDGARRLLADIERTALDDEGRVDVPGLGLWSDASLDAEEVAVLRDFSARAGWLR